MTTERATETSAETVQPRSRRRKKPEPEAVVEIPDVDAGAADETPDIVAEQVDEELAQEEAMNYPDDTVNIASPHRYAMPCVFCQGQFQVDPREPEQGKIIAEPSLGIKHYVCAGCSGA